MARVVWIETVVQHVFALVDDSDRAVKLVADPVTIPAPRWDDYIKTDLPEAIASLKAQYAVTEDSK